MWLSGKDHPELKSLVVFLIIWPLSFIAIVIFKIFIPISDSAYKIALFSTVLFAALIGLTFATIEARKDHSSWLKRAIRFFLLPVIVFSVIIFRIYYDMF